jgi:hypothetical protein
LLSFFYPIRPQLSIAIKGSVLWRSRCGNNVACQTNLAFAEEEHVFVKVYFNTGD